MRPAVGSWAGIVAIRYRGLLYCFCKVYALPWSGRVADVALTELWNGAPSATSCGARAHRAAARCSRRSSPANRSDTAGIATARLRRYRRQWFPAGRSRVPGIEDIGLAHGTWESAWTLTSGVKRAGGRRVADARPQPGRRGAASAIGTPLSRSAHLHDPVIEDEGGRARVTSNFHPSRVYNRAASARPGNRRPRNRVGDVQL